MFFLGDPSPAAPQPFSIDGAHISELLKANMAANLFNLNSRKDKVLVPGHYAIFLHAEFYEELSPAFKDLARSLGEDLTEEVARLRMLEPNGARLKQHTTPRDIRPLDDSWTFDFIAVTEILDQDGGPPREAPRHYLAVASRLARPDLSSPDEGNAKVTVKDPFKGFESHFMLDSDLKKVGKDTVTVKVPFAPGDKAKGPQAGKPSGATQPEATLTYQYPGQTETHTYALKEPEIRIGCVRANNSHVHLRLHDAHVSGEHARIRWNADQRRFELVDVSSNGTTVNGVRVPKSQPINNVFHWHPLSDGARIGLAGSMELTFHIHNKK